MDAPTVAVTHTYCLEGAQLGQCEKSCCLTAEYAPVHSTAITGVRAAAHGGLVLSSNACILLSKPSEVSVPCLLQRRSAVTKQSKPKNERCRLPDNGRSGKGVSHAPSSHFQPFTDIADYTRKAEREIGTPACCALHWPVRLVVGQSLGRLRMFTGRSVPNRSSGSEDYGR